MLTGKMVRVRFARDRIIPRYLEVNDTNWREVAERLLELFRGREGCRRGQLQEDQHEAFGNDPGQLVHQGLAKLLEDRCDFETIAEFPPEQIRAAVFRAAVNQRRSGTSLPGSFDRGSILKLAASELQLSPEAIDQGLFADLKSEQRLIAFKDISPQHLLERYNVALAQAVLLRATNLQVDIRNETPQRYRQLLRRAKFHRLVCETDRVAADVQRLRLDGPLSLFAATQKYGLQLALFLPAVLHCRRFELVAEIRWGPQRKVKTLHIGSDDGLVSRDSDTGVYAPAELNMFADLFRKRIADWELLEETEIFPLGSGYWVPDFRLVHRPTGRAVLLEVLGFWRKSSVEQHLARLRAYATRPFLLAVSEQLRVDDSDLESLPASIHRFRSMPLPDEIARLARALIDQR